MAKIDEAPSLMYNVKSYNNNTQERNVTQGKDSQVSSTDWDPDHETGVSKPEIKNPETPAEDTPVVNPGEEVTPTPEPVVPDSGDAATEGLGWFAMHFKEIAIITAAAAVLAGIIALVKTMSKSIKVRYNKCLKLLQKMQKDFTLKPDGLNMKAVLPGVGSRINDWVSRLFTWNWKSGRNTKGNIGLHPFCNRYKAEIGEDYETAKIAFSKIRATVDKRGEINSSSETAFASFHEALTSGELYEGYTEDMNESVIMSLAVPLILTGIKVGAGVFKAPKIDKKGNIIPGQEVGVQVTKESTREICYAIINNFADKYINMNAVFNKLGIDSKSLSDLDTSSCDKLSKMFAAYAKPEPNAYTKQYSRIKGAYDKMLKHYYAIGDGLIDNFKKYTVADDEKHANLLVASTEKLKNMWDTQKDVYDNNFSHVIIEIISSPNYVNYLNFIINYVMPVFKSGIAGDADYVLDLNPKKNDFYVVKQIGNNDALGGTTKIPEGKSVFVEIEGFDKDAKKITFKLLGLVTGDYEIDSNSGLCDLNGVNIDFNAYKEDGKYDVVNISYADWMSLDPTPALWEPFYKSGDYVRTKDVDGATLEQHIYAYRRNDKDMNGFDSFVYVSINPKYEDIVAVTKLKTNSPLEKIEGLFKEAGFKKSSDEISEEIFNAADSCKNKNDVEVGDGASLLEYLKSHNPGLPIPVKSSDLYKKEDDKFDIYIYADADSDLESEQSDMTTKLNEDDTLDPDGNGADNKNISGCYVCSVNKGSDLIDGDAKKINFNGSYVKLNPCSIREFDKKMNALNFSIVKDDANKIKKNIRINIQYQRGYVKTAALPGEYDVNTIEDPIEQISGRMDYIDLLKKNEEQIASNTFDTIQKLERIDKPYPVSNIEIVSKFVKPNQKSVIKMFDNDFSVSTDVKRDGNDTKVRVNGQGYLTINKKPVLILRLEGINRKTTFYYPAELTKDSIKKALGKLIEMAESGNQVDVKSMPKFELASGESASKNPKQVQFSLDDCIKDFVSLIVFDASSGKVVVKDPKTIETKCVKIIPLTQKTPNAMGVVFKVGDKLFQFRVDNYDKGDVDISVDNNKIHYGVDSINDMPAKIKSLYDDWSKAQQPKTESVTYESFTNLRESEGNVVRITRHISGNHKNAYILSEAVYKDYMNDGVSKLDESAFVNSLKTKDDCIKFAKQNINSNFVRFSNDTRYNVASQRLHGFSDDKSKSLYESCLIVEFNDEDRIIKKTNLGKNKIF